VERGSDGRRHTLGQGQLNEDVNGSNIVVNSKGQITQPTDVAFSVTGYPLAVIFDATVL
jgi:hypothetical protein